MFSTYGSFAEKKTRKKSKKNSHNNWFEKCNLDELKKLCRASNLPVSGTKAALCQRLCQGELSRDYAYEYAPERCSRARFEVEMRGYGSGGESHSQAHSQPAQQGSKRASAFSNNDLKSKCREIGLVVSGKRFDLVLRLLQNASGNGGVPKRMAGTMNDDGIFQPRKRTKSMKLPNLLKIQERSFKKVCPPRETQMKWSDRKHKEHGSECVKFASNVIEKEVFEKGLFEREEEELAWGVIDAVLHYIVYGDQEFERAYYAEQRAKYPGQIYMAICTRVGLGRAGYELSYHLFPQLISAIKDTSSKEKVREYGGEILRKFEEEAKQYGVVNDDFSSVLNEYLPLEI